VAIAFAVALGGCQTLNDAVSGSDSTVPDAPALAAPPAATVAPAAATMRGMTGETLRSLWGEPSLKRNEPGAELWQYGGTGGCTLLVYLYAGTVTHAEAVPGGADEASIAACAKASGKPPLKPIS
jgi:hypothetical protein